ncbi:protein cholesin isoform X1 [Brachyhypopomus gauderio]|uniref:protein cholesin isoform X1 n=1 Tax=Brachyhypopomus gauderio TaxID=698409 RepID=UPI00404372C2
MPVFCAACGCNNRRSIETKSRGITFHKFPRVIDLRRQWEVAVRREGFVATESSKICSEHFKPDDFDRTGQIVRLRDGVTPTVFSFSSHLKRPVVKRSTKPSRKAVENLPVDLSQHIPEREPQSNDDHSYDLPRSPTYLQARLREALGRVKTLQREKLNAKARERRAKKTIMSLLEDLKEKNRINEELKDRLDFHSGGISVNMAARRKTNEKKTSKKRKKRCVNQDQNDDKETERKQTDHETSEARDDATVAKRRRTANSDASDVIGDLTKNESLEGLPTPTEEEDLTPEERRVAERKLKKLRRKAEKQKQKEMGKKEAEPSKTSSAQTQALEYLTCWSEKREEWKFQKTRQVWLLQHMYDSEKVSDAHFKVLLSYLEGLRGVARDTTAKKAEAIVRFGEGPEEVKGGATDSQKTLRAREVVQILS